MGNLKTLNRKDWCDEFSACDYVDYEFTIFAAASLVVSGTSTPPPTPQNMYDIVCSREKFDDNRDICRDLCDEYECCFNSGGKSELCSIVNISHPVLVTI